MEVLNNLSEATAGTEAVFPPVEGPTPEFPYRVLSQVGEGSMGTVYLALEPALGRQVAIKIPMTKQGDVFWAPSERHEAHLRFLQEARSAAVIQHPGAVTIHRVGQVGGLPYIAMEWLEGEPLSLLLRREGRLPLDTAVEVAVQVLDTLQSAHAAGVTHRDIKPANIVLLKDGRAKVVDFGIAQYRAAGLVETRAGIVFGTPFYASPEQLRGEAIDARSDVFSLSVVLYEMLTGSRPFQGNNAHEFLAKLLTTAAEPITSLRPDVPEEVAQAVQRGLARDRAQRWPSAAEMAASLRAGTGRRERSDVFPSSGQIEVQNTVRVVGRTSYPVVRTLRGTLVEAVSEYVRSWPARELPAQPVDALLPKLLDRPLHAAPFSGAVELGSVLLLIHDGDILGALAPLTGALRAVGSPRLPATASPKLYLPGTPDAAGIVPLLAGLAHARTVRQSVLDSSIVSAEVLSQRLLDQGFEGILRLAAGGDSAAVLFSHGRPLLGVVVGPWPGFDVEATWSRWAAAAPVQIELEAVEVRPLPVSFGIKHRDLEITCHWRDDDTSRTATTGPATRRLARLASRVSAAGPRADLEARVPPGGDPVELTSDPAARLLQWLIGDAHRLFSDAKLGNRWKYLAEWIPLIRSARLYHDLAIPGEPARQHFDLVTQDSAGKLLHLAVIFESLTLRDFESAVEAAVAAKLARLDTGDIGALLVVAPAFQDSVIAAYLAKVEASTHGVARLQETLTGYAGFVRLGRKRGFHLLLVEDRGGSFDAMLE